MTKALTGLIVAVLSLAGLAIIALALLFVSLPDVTALKKCITTEMYHVHLCDKDPTFTPYGEISPFIVGAVIMSEDASFYSHSGVDVEEMKESAIKDMNEGRFARGGSTITQQLAKNVFLTGSKNILRKVEEIYLALQIEKHFSKQRILTLYLNVVEFGDGIYGIRAACKHYFDKPPTRVTPEQAAFLIFLLPNPKKYSQSFAAKQLTPFAVKTVKTILHKMELGHKINDSEYQDSISRVAFFPWREAVPNAANNGREIPAAGAPGADTTDSPMGITSDNAADAAVDKDAQSLIPKPTDESNQSDDDFKFDFNPE